MTISQRHDEGNFFTNTCLGQFLFCIALVAIGIPTLSPGRLVSAEEVKTTAEHVAVESRLSDAVKYLASDELGGRGVGTEGLDLAAEYIAQQFADFGLRTDLFDGAPFQEFAMSMTAELGDSSQNHLAFVPMAEAEPSSGHQPIVLQLADDFFPLAIGGSGAIEHELVFAGYGISAPDLGYDDYADIDVKGKVVLLLRKEPNQGDEQSIFDGARPSRYATFQSKVRTAKERGAVGVIFVNDHYEIQRRTDERRKALQQTLFLLTAAHAEHQAQDAPNESQTAAYLKKVEELSKRAYELSQELSSDGFDQLVSFLQAGNRREADFPIFFVARRHVDQLLTAAGKPGLVELEAEIDAHTRPRSFDLEGWKVRGAADIVVRKETVKNVVAVLDGEGDVAHETIVIGAHYDHLGMGGPGSLAPWTVDIHHGADDNASGTAAILELARRFALSETKPRRRLVFIAFTGEESGLLGSNHYVNNPRFDLVNTVAMLNLDMVGRLTDNQLTIYGTGTAEEFDELIDRINENHQFKLRKLPSGFGPSDHASFYGKDVPVLFPFTGLHRDYHRPSDKWDKINFEGMRRIVDFSEDVLLAIDEMPERPQLVKRGRWGFMMDRFGGRRSGERRERPRRTESADEADAPSSDGDTDAPQEQPAEALETVPADTDAADHP